MGNHKNSIELNGKIYDVATGRQIKATLSQPQVKKLTNQRPKTVSKKGTIVDGFVRTQIPIKNNTQQKTQKKHTPAKNGQIHKASLANNIGINLQKSRTLMREAVKKPSIKKHEDNRLSTKHDKERLQRAQKVKKSNRIKRFVSPLHNNAKNITQKAHNNGTKQDKAPRNENTYTNASYLTAISPISQKTESRAKPHSKSEEAIANAMLKANSHQARKSRPERPKHRLARNLGFSRKAANMALTALTIIILGGFVLYQNIPNLSMRIASSRAGFSANMPGYKPSGFSMSGPVEYGPGKVKISFSSNSDQRSFSLTQQVSNWNSSALVDNYMVASNKQYQTFDDNGKTIFIYDSSNATWVSGGVWYQIEGDSSLNSDQLLKIANSI